MSSFQTFSNQLHVLPRKARMVAGGHVIESSMFTNYSSVVQTRTIRILETIATNKGLKLITGDIGNAFIHDNTKEELYSRAGPEFGDQKGCLIEIKKALYGLSTSARQWNLALGEAIRNMGFIPSRANPDLWLTILPEHDKYEYIATYVDDIIIVAMDPTKYLDVLADKFPIRHIETNPSYYLENDLNSTTYHYWMKQG